MPDESESTERSLEELGIRNIEGSYNINSGRLEEIVVKVMEPISMEETWFEVCYSIDLGTAKIKLIPEISEPRKLAAVLTRSDEAVRRLKPVDEVIRWHEKYMEDYGSMELAEAADLSGNLHSRDPVDIRDEE